MGKMEEYGEVAGLRINQKKIKVKNMQKEDQSKLKEKTGFLQVSKVRYLGIQVSSKTSTLMKDNYLNLLQDVQKDLVRWGNCNFC